MQKKEARIPTDSSSEEEEGDITMAKSKVKHVPTDSDEEDEIPA